MTIEHSMKLADLVEEYGYQGVIRELKTLVEEEHGEAALHELDGEYTSLMSIGVDDSLAEEEPSDFQ